MLANSFTRRLARGGGISNEGVLTITNSVVSGNSSALGGGINNNGPTALVETQVNGKTASESGGGAGIYNVDTLTLDNVRLYNNHTGY